MTTSTLILVFACSALITFGLRAVPFALFGRTKEVPALIRRLGDLLPYAVITALVIYCLKDITTMGLTENVKMLAAAASCVAVHLWKKNTILSIAVSTVLYMVLLHI